MKLFTSIPARIDNSTPTKYSHISKTWKTIAGADLYSLNHSEELREHPLLDSEIRFIDCGKQEIFDYSRKPLVSIQIAIDHIYREAEIGELVGIVNSDILPNSLYDWRAFDTVVSNHELHVFKRLEQLPAHKKTFDPFAPYRYGYDLFMFRVTDQLIQLNDQDNFCFGVPWWDYWFPLTLKFEHSWQLVSHDRPLIFHLTHQEQFTQSTWHQKAETVRKLFSKWCRETSDRALYRAINTSYSELCNICCDIIDRDFDVFRYNSIKDSTSLKSGITIVSACMNRNDNLKKCLHSWINKKSVVRIIIVDWSSSKDLKDDLMESGIHDPRIEVIRVEGKTAWCLTKAFNIGLKIVDTLNTLKLDADIMLEDGFFEHNKIEKSFFRCGNYKIANNDLEKRVNGSFFAPTIALKAVSYYNEEIDTYGWDDSDLYERLEIILMREDFCLDSISHIEQEERTRLENQKENFGLSPIIFQSISNQELEIRRNQIKCRLLPRPNHYIPMVPDAGVLVDYLSYRTFLINNLSYGWEDGGVGIKEDILAKMTTFTLACLYACRHEEKWFNLSGLKGVDFLSRFVKYHPVPSEDLKYFGLYNDGYVQEPLNSESNDFLQPTLGILRRMQEVSKKFKVRFALNRPFYEYISLSEFYDIKGKDHKRSSRIQSISSRVRASIITVAVNSTKYLSGFCEDLNGLIRSALNQIHFFIILPSSSSLSDLHGMSELGRLHADSVSLIILSWDPGLYDCWNMVCKDTKSDYIGNWNCDDRRSRNHINSLIKVLDKHPECIGASTAIYITEKIPGPYEQHKQICDNVWFEGSDFMYDYQDMYQEESWVRESNRLVSQNFMHCMPLWRSSLHSDNDYFWEVEYGPSADWEFWMRMSKKLSSKFYLIGQPMGIYFMNTSSYGRREEAERLEENINRKYLNTSRLHRSFDL